MIVDHWTSDHHARLGNIVTFSDAAAFAIEMLAQLSVDRSEIVQICGPMTTGGLGSLERNMERFAIAIERMRVNGRMVFNQIPFQDLIIRITDHHAGQAYRMDILTDFYQPIFASGLVTHAIFLPGWERSTGATEERAYAQRFGLAIEEYPEAWLTDSAV